MNTPIQVTPGRQPLCLTPRENGGVMISLGRTYLLLNRDEVRALAEHLKDS